MEKVIPISLKKEEYVLLVEYLLEFSEVLENLRDKSYVPTIRDAYMDKIKEVESLITLFKNNYTLPLE